MADPRDEPGPAGVDDASDASDDSPDPDDDRPAAGPPSEDVSAEHQTAADATAGDPGPPEKGRRRRWPRRVALVVGAVVVLWVGFTAVRLATAAGDAARGVDAMQAARETATGDLGRFVDSVGRPGSSESKRLDAQLADATDAFRSAHDTVESPVIGPLRSMPILGRQIRSVSALSSAAATTTAATRTSFHRLSDIAASAPDSPAARVAAGRQTQDVLSGYADSVRGLDLGPRTGLVGPLADAYNRFAVEDQQLHDTLGRALTAVTGVNQFLSGPTRYLVVAANNAEMRAGSGMFLQAGELTVDGGRFSLSDMEPTAKMVLPKPGTTLDPDVASLWDWTYPDREFRAVNVTPRFDESARMAADMWTAAGHAPVDGVIAMDVVGLQRLLRLVGPVEVSGPDGHPTTITADDVIQQLLVQQYLDAGQDTTLRRDRLSEVASAVFDAMNHRAFSPGQLLRALQGSGRRRHLLAWSRDPVEQAGWVALGTSGVLDGSSMLLSVLNRGGNKLDQFLVVDSEMRWSQAGDVRHVSVTVRIANHTPDGLPRYVVGPFPGLGTSAGEYVGVLALTVPRSAFRPATEGAEMVLSGNDGPTRVIGAKVDVRAGATTAVTFRFDVPLTQREIRVQPSARVPPSTWHAAGTTWTDDELHVVRLTR